MENDLIKNGSVEFGSKWLNTFDIINISTALCFLLLLGLSINKNWEKVWEIISLNSAFTVVIVGMGIISIINICFSLKGFKSDISTNKRIITFIFCLLSMIGIFTNIMLLFPGI